jgi:hypothetical protein
MPLMSNLAKLKNIVQYPSQCFCEENFDVFVYLIVYFNFYFLCKSNF